MYEFLQGQLIEKNPAAVILAVNGVGYHVSIPVSSYAALPALGETARLLVHFVVREDAQILYGFMTDEERQLFRLLISVSGIGPKTAITALSGIAPSELKQAIVDGAVAVLITIPGIGKKTAERMVVELKEKIVVEERRLPGSAAVARPGAWDALTDDSIRALIELGYRKQNAKAAVERALKENPNDRVNVSDLVRLSLKYV